MFIVSTYMHNIYIHVFAHVHIYIHILCTEDRLGFLRALEEDFCLANASRPWGVQIVLGEATEV